MTKYSYSEFLDDSLSLSKMLNDYKPDTIVAIARGGMTLAHRLSMILDIRNVTSISSIYYDDKKKLDDVTIFNIPNLSKSKKILVVDDIVDSGKTMSKIINLLKKDYDLEYKSMAIFYKKSAMFTPDIWLKNADDWIEFFWEEI
jgi:xanthine phosphoribosyltransferase